MENCTVYYLPALHPEGVPDLLRPYVSLLPTGLAPRALPSGDAAHGALPLPLDASGARLALAEMQRMGGDLNEILRQTAFAGDTGPVGLPPDSEMDDLAAFAATGQAPADPGRSEREERAAARAVLVGCQKILLLAYAREQLERETAQLEQRTALAQDKLSAIFQADPDDPVVPTPPDGILFPLGPETSTGCPWRLILESALPFVPENAVFLTADPCVLDALREEGLFAPAPPVAPQPEDAACLRPLRGLPGRLLFARQPALRITGRRHPLPHRPWLERTITLYALEPDAHS